MVKKETIKIRFLAMHYLRHDYASHCSI